MSVGLKRSGRTVDIGLETLTGLDAQSKSSYNALVTIRGRVVREDKVVLMPDGSQVRTQYTAWIDGGESFLPRWHDRLTITTLGEQHTAIVEEHSERKRPNGTVDHVRVRAREE